MKINQPHTLEKSQFQIVERPKQKTKYTEPDQREVRKSLGLTGTRKDFLIDVYYTHRTLPTTSRV